MALEPAHQPAQHRQLFIEFFRRIPVVAVHADAAIFVALGEEAGEFNYTLDTTAFPNGDHALRLRVVRSGGNYDEYIAKFTLANGGATAAAAPAAASNDIVATAIGAGQFKTLVAAVQAAGLVEKLGPRN